MSLKNHVHGISLLFLLLARCLHPRSFFCGLKLATEYSNVPKNILYKKSVSFSVLFCPGRKHFLAVPQLMTSGLYWSKFYHMHTPIYLLAQMEDAYSNQSKADCIWWEVPGSSNVYLSMTIRSTHVAY